MFEVFNRGQHTLISLLRLTIVLFITTCTANGVRLHIVYTPKCLPSILYYPSDHECAVLCTICDRSEWFDAQGDPYLHLPLVSSLFLKPNPMSCGTPPIELRSYLIGGASTIYVCPRKR